MAPPREAAEEDVESPEVEPDAGAALSPLLLPGACAEGPLWGAALSLEAEAAEPRWLTATLGCARV